MKNFLMIVFCALFFVGCASVENFAEPQEKIAKEQNMGEIMLEAFKKQNFESYTQFIPAGGRQAYNKEKFRNEQKEIFSRMGKIDSYRFLTRLEKEPLHEFIWAVRFFNYSLKGKKVYREAIFSIVVGEVDGARKVFLFGFK